MEIREAESECVCVGRVRVCLSGKRDCLSGKREGGNKCKKIVTK